MKLGVSILVVVFDVVKSTHKILNTSIILSFTFIMPVLFNMKVTVGF